MCTKECTNLGVAVIASSMYLQFYWSLVTHTPVTITNHLLHTNGPIRFVPHPGLSGGILDYKLQRAAKERVQCAQKNVLM